VTESSSGTSSASSGAPLDEAVTRVVDALKQYVAVARGVRGEFAQDQAMIDPRVDSAYETLGLALGRLEDEFEDEFGFAASVEPLWEGEETDELEDDDVDLSAATAADEDLDGAELLALDGFSMGMVVGVSEGSIEQLDAVVGILDDAAGDLVGRLEAEGFVVTQYYVARGDDGDLLDGLDDDELDDDDDLNGIDGDGTEEP
jgi:hypothetical protein